MKKVLVIRTADKEFGEQLAKNFNKSSDFAFQTYVFSEVDAFKEFSKNNIINVLLCDEDIAVLEGDGLRADLLINLTEVNVAREGGFVAINKYQSSEDIMKEIKQLYSQFMMPDIPKEKPKSLIKKLCCVCSPIGGSFKSTFALALADHYSQTESTIFLTFDAFFKLPNKEKDSREGTLSDLWLYLTQGSGIDYSIEEMAEHIRFCATRRGNLDLLNSVSYWYDICDIDEEIMHNILHTVSNSGMYQNAVLDLGFFGKPSLEALREADIIYVPVVETPLNREKLAEFKRQLIFSNNEDLLKKIKEVNIPIDEGLKGEYDYSDLLKGKLGMYIRSLNL